MCAVLIIVVFPVLASSSLRATCLVNVRETAKPDLIEDGPSLLDADYGWMWILWIPIGVCPPRKGGQGYSS
ncbi:unnamed protein product [Knipowitschia caucasica]